MYQVYKIEVRKKPEAISAPGFLKEKEGLFANNKTIGSCKIVGDIINIRIGSQID